MFSSLALMRFEIVLGKARLLPRGCRIAAKYRNTNTRLGRSLALPKLASGWQCQTIF
jgi:hypothetical protein